ncbi:uncharacterized protein LOC144179793 [Haemaphysalis longicornis]
MPGDAQHTAPPSPPAVICSGAIRQRDPPQFSGADDQDVEDWLSSFERVSAYNRWDEVTKLSNAGFSLRGVAEQWFLNHPADRSTWTAFTTNITRVFGRPAVRKLLAEQRLRERAQQAGETFTCYIEDVVDLCRRANPSMPEQDTVKHILKGIDEDAFQMLLAKNPQNVSEVVSLCQSYEELRRQRTLTRRRLSQRDDPLCALEVDGNPSLLRRIKELIREEVARQISLLPCLPQQSSPTQDPAQSSPLHQIIRAQVADAISAAPEPLPVTPPLCYAEVAARTPAHAYVPRRRPQPPPHLTQPYREPRTFSGNEGYDFGEWLVHYDRVSKFNHWDAAAKRANVEVFLTGTALTWFENHEAKLTTWDRLHNTTRWTTAPIPIAWSPRSIPFAGKLAGATDGGVNNTFKTVATDTVLTTDTAIAEEAAIAMAATTTQSDYVTILPDSQEACRNFL